MKEKVLQVKLPQGAKYRDVIVTDRGILNIVYSKDDTEGSKPQKLIGGTEVYQKEGMPYWFCKIKDGRDEFMHIFMDDLSDEDLFYDSNGTEREFVTDEEIEFKENVLKALENKPKEGYRWLPVYEPSVDSINGLKYVSGEEPATGIYVKEWENLFSNYSKENSSCISTKTTYFLLLLRWLKDSIATFDQIVHCSSHIGNYNRKGEGNRKENTGERFFGGLYGFVGNTYKIIRDFNSEPIYFLAGGCYFSSGKKETLSHVERDYYFYEESTVEVGLIELK